MESARSATFDVPTATAPQQGEEQQAAAGAKLDGDVTDALAAKATPREKADLVEKLNADAKRQQQQEIKRIVHEQAAAILRHRLVSSVSAESAKAYMATITNGLVARTVVIDVTKPRTCQSGVKSPTLKTEHVVSMQTCLCVLIIAAMPWYAHRQSTLTVQGRQISLAPTTDDQKAWASQVKLLPATPIVGHVLIRPAMHSVDTLNQELVGTHVHKRSIIVPIAIPSEFARYLNSTQKRSSGPSDEETSGIDFVMRTIGRKFDKCDKKKATDTEADREIDQDDPAEDDANSDEDPDVDDDMGESSESAKLNKTFERMVDPALLSPTQLKAIFGERAGDLSGVFFQHSTRIAERAEFLARAGCFMWRPNDRAHPRRYCKGQVHPSVYVSAFRSALASSNMPLSQNEVLVDLTGGTPEVIVAAVVAGYKRVFYIGDENEHVMMQFPNLDQTVDWDECPPKMSRGVVWPAPNTQTTRECLRGCLQVHLPGHGCAKQGCPCCCRCADVSAVRGECNLQPEKRRQGGLNQHPKSTGWVMTWCKCHALPPHSLARCTRQRRSLYHHFACTPSFL